MSETEDLAPLVGHRIAWGRVYMHILTIRDGGLVDGHGEGRTVTASTMYEHALCGRVQGGALRVTSWSGTVESVQKIHDDRLARMELWPELRIPANRRACPTCFERYETAREAAKALKAANA